jgi:hypothetical protein
VTKFIAVLLLLFGKMMVNLYLLCFLWFFLFSFINMVLKLEDFSFKVYLAMEAGYSEKVDELCERYSLEGFLNVKGMVCVCFLVLPWASY